MDIPMELTAEQCLEAAYQALGGDRATFDAKGLHRAAGAEWSRLRKQSIERDAESTLQRVPAARLLALYALVADRVFDLVGYTWEPPDPDDTDEVCYFVAWGLACLRQYHRERTGRAWYYDLAQAAVTAWLAQRRPAQPQQLGLWAAQ
jgi:hypothetical protein